MGPPHLGYGEVMLQFRIGFTSFVGTRGALFRGARRSFVRGLEYLHYAIFLDRRENTFCVPMHCGSSMLSGITATYFLTFLFAQRAPSVAQMASRRSDRCGAGFLHRCHHFDRVLSKLKYLLARLGQLRHLRNRYSCARPTTPVPCLSAVAIPAVRRWPQLLLTPRSPG